MIRRSAILLVAAAAALTPSMVLAQEAAPDEAEAARVRANDTDADDDITLRMNAGAALAYGNARNFALSLGAGFHVRRGMHSFLVEASWVYGLAATRLDAEGMPPNYEFGELTENANNFTGLLRYDAFVDNDNAVFVSARVRNDPFARLQPRLSGQIGYLRTLFREENHRFWTEVGVDFTYDRFGEALAVGGLDAAGMPLTSDDRGVGSLRLYVGYDNQINSALTYRTGLEFLWGPLRTVGADQTAAMRFEWINQLRSSIEDWLQISLDVTARFDAAPPGQIDPWNEQPNQATQMFDLLTTLNLVGTFDLDGADSEEEEEEEAECETPECPECEAPPADEPAPAAEEPVAEEPVEQPAPETDDSDAETNETEPEADAEPVVN